MASRKRSVFGVMGVLLGFIEYLPSKASEDWRII